MLIVISGAAGCGKDTIVQSLFNEFGDCATCPEGERELFYSVSTTTRKIRAGEVDGTHYFYKSREEFEELVKQDEFLEHTEYCGNYYGTSKKTVLSALAKGKNIILKIECEGAANVKRMFPDAVLIFILAPSISELRRRLENRSTECPVTIEQRIAKAREEIELSETFDYQVVNDDLETAVADVIEIICKMKAKQGISPKDGLCRTRAAVQPALPVGRLLEDRPSGGRIMSTTEVKHNG
jgi:guanylate kinase